MNLLLDKFTDYIGSVRKLSDNTVESYCRDIKQYIEYIESKNIHSFKNTNKTTVITYLLFLQKNGRATSTISRSLASIRAFYQYMTTEKIIDRDPTVDLESPKVEKKLPTILSGKEVELLLDQPDLSSAKGVRDKSMLELLYATGIRVSELVALNLVDINLELGYLKCCKNNDRERIIPVGTIALEILGRYISDVRPVLLRARPKQPFTSTIKVKGLPARAFGK